MAQYHAVHVSQADSLACVYFNELPARGYVSYAVVGPLHNGRLRFQESYFTFIPCRRAATLAPTRGALRCARRSKFHEPAIKHLDGGLG